MTCDKQILRTKITMRIECTGNQVRALQQMLLEADVNAGNHERMQMASELVNEVADTYDGWFAAGVINPTLDDD